MLDKIYDLILDKFTVWELFQALVFSLLLVILTYPYLAPLDEDLILLYLFLTAALELTIYKFIKSKFFKKTP